jgi:hypothetical protein
MIPWLRRVPPILHQVVEQDATLVELLLCRFVAVDIRQLADAVPLQAAMQ